MTFRVTHALESEPSAKAKERILKEQRVCQVGHPGCTVTPMTVIRVADREGWAKTVAACPRCVEAEAAR